jgi:hypothetical protein
MLSLLFPNKNEIIDNSQNTKENNLQLDLRIVKKIIQNLL